MKKYRLDTYLFGSMEWSSVTSAFAPFGKMLRHLLTFLTYISFWLYTHAYDIWSSHLSQLLDSAPTYLNPRFMIQMYIHITTFLLSSFSRFCIGKEISSEAKTGETFWCSEWVQILVFGQYFIKFSLGVQDCFWKESEHIFHSGFPSHYFPTTTWKQIIVIKVHLFSNLKSRRKMRQTVKKHP